jgi:AraC family transcriptional regulator, arabinose operon regulatory protein
MGVFSFAVLSESEIRLPFYLVGAGCDFNQDLDPHTRPDGYPYYQWIQCYEGEGILRLGEAAGTGAEADAATGGAEDAEAREEVVSPDYAIFLHPGVPHEYFPRSKPWMVHWFTFGGSGVPAVLEAIGMKSSGVYGIGNAAILTDRIRYGLKQLVSKDPFHGMECSALVYDFLITLMKYAHRRDDEPAEQKYERLRPAFDYIAENCEGPISIRELAGAVDVTPQHFCRLFKSATKQRPFEYINSYRIARSKDLMVQNPELPVSEVAEMCGYESLNYFCSVFRRLEGVSPGHYRKLHGVA